MGRGVAATGLGVVATLGEGVVGAGVVGTGVGAGVGGSENVGGADAATAKVPGEVPSTPFEVAADGGADGGA